MHFKDHSVTIQWLFSAIRPSELNSYPCSFQISNWNIVFNPARTAKEENTYVLICLWILYSFRKLFTLREQRKHTSIYTSSVDKTRVSKYSCVTCVISLSFQKAFNSRERRHRHIIIQKTKMTSFSSHLITDSCHFSNVIIHIFNANLHKKENQQLLSQLNTKAINKIYYYLDCS